MPEQHSIFGEIAKGYLYYEVLPKKASYLATTGLRIPFSGTYVGGSDAARWSLRFRLGEGLGNATYTTTSRVGGLSKFRYATTTHVAESSSLRAGKLVEKASRGITARLPGIGAIVNPKGRRAFKAYQAARQKVTAQIMKRSALAKGGPFGLVPKFWSWGSWKEGAKAAGLSADAVGVAQYAVGKVGAFANAALWPLFISEMALGVTYGLGKAAGGAISEIGGTILSRRPEYSTPFYESERTYTMRQSGLMAIHQSQFGRGSHFGREAELMHQ